MHAINVGQSIIAEQEPPLQETRDRVRYALVARLPRPIEIRVEDLYLHIAGSTKPTMGYHITLVGPFFVLGDGDHRTLSGITEVCRDWQPFSVRLGGLGSYVSPDNSAVYLRLMDPAPISALNHALTLALAGQIETQIVCIPEIDEACYQPHVTLALMLTDRELGEFRRVGSEELTGASFEINELWLVQEMSNSSWRFVECYPLGDAAESAAYRLNRTYN
jgi:2'-5' RNA ligase